MKKKIIAIALIIIIICVNYVFAVDCYAISEEPKISEGPIANIATEISNDIYKDGIYDAYSKAVSISDVSITNGQSSEKVNINNLPTSYDEIEENATDKFYLTVMNNIVRDRLMYTFKVGDYKNTTNITSLLYKNAINYNGNDYDLNIIVKAVRGSEDAEVRITVGEKVLNMHEFSSEYAEASTEGTEQEIESLNIAEYTDLFNINVGTRFQTKDSADKVEIDLEYQILKSDKTPSNISGVLEITDVDLNQGIVIKDFTPKFNEKNKAENIYIKHGTDVSEINYKVSNGNTAIYSTTDQNKPDEKDASVYTLIENRNKVDFTFTFEAKSAYSALKFSKDVIKTYHKIITEVVGGNITPTVTHKKDGESETISYSPNYKDRQYLVSVTVDGETQDITKYESSYKFENIKKDHKIKVVYANKYVVTFDTNGGTANPKDQYVMPNEKATKPENPTKTGYQFDGWKIKESTGNAKYDFTTPVTKDTDLEAIWKAVPYKIIYHIDADTKNNDKNPTEYTVEKTEKFENPTKPGYDFKGWYLDEEYTNPISDTTGRTGELNLYPKWEASKDTAYKVEHYKQKEDGTYEKVITEELTGTTGEKVIATPKEYKGYTENTTYKERIAEGTIKPDGSLVLKLYYDLNKYKIDYELYGGANNAKNPSEYTVKKTEEFVDPTKQGYDFKGWYLDEEFTKSISTTYGYAEDLKLYAKWEASKDTVYKVEHYTKNDNGEYAIYATDSLTGTTGEKVTAVAKQIAGYTENTTYSGRVSEGIIAPDGSLVLKLYYDKVPAQLPATGEEQNGENTSNVIAITTAGVVLVAAILFGKKYKDLKNI